MSLFLRDGRLLLGGSGGLRLRGIPAGAGNKTTAVTLTAGVSLSLVAGTNPAPADLVINTTQVAEGTAAGIDIARIDAIDPGDTSWTFALVAQSTSGLFSLVNANAGAWATLRTASTVPSQATASSHTVTVRATDPAGGWREKTFTLAVVSAEDDTVAADFRFFPAGSPNNRVQILKEGDPANTVVGTVSVDNPSSGTANTAATWSIVSQSTPNLFKISAQSAGSATLALNTTAPSWSAANAFQTITLKRALDSNPSGLFTTRDITVTLLRNGVTPRLHPLDGWEIDDTLTGPIGLLYAAGAVNKPTSFTVVNDNRFYIYGRTDGGRVARQLAVTSPLAPGIYTVIIRATNSNGSADFTRTITVQSKTVRDATFPWKARVDAGWTRPSITTTLPQTVVIRNDSASASNPDDYVSFYLHFPPGLIGINERPVLTSGSVRVYQLDGVRYWRDANGNPTSLQGGRFTVSMPAITANGSANLTVTKEAGSLSSGGSAPAFNPATDISIVDHGASTAAGDNRAAIQSALDAARTAGKRVYIPPGTWNRGEGQIFVGVTLFGSGDASVIHCTATSNSAFRMDRNNAVIEHVKLTHAVASRQSGRQHNMITVFHQTGTTQRTRIADCRVSYVTIDGSPAVGIYTGLADRIHLHHNTIRNTLADSIHNTLASGHITVEYNRIENSGDDGVACVSPSDTQWPPTGAVSNVVGRYNSIVGQVGGRGMTVVGGRDIEYHNNYIEGGANGRAGVLIALEGNWGSTGVENVTIRNNTIKTAGGTGTGHGAIDINNNVAITTAIRDIKIRDNQIYQAKKDAIRIFGGSDNRDIILENNMIYDPASGNAVVNDGAANVTNTNNPLRASATYPGDANSLAPGSADTGPAAPRTAAEAKANLAGKNWNFRASIGGVAHTATVTQADLDNARTVMYGAGPAGHGFRVITPFKRNSDNVEHADVFVVWYLWHYRWSATEAMPVIHNTWRGARGSHTLSSCALRVGTTTVSSWYPASISTWGHSFWHAGTNDVRPVLDTGASYALHADYSQCLGMLWEAGVIPPLSSSAPAVVPSPAAPVHQPGLVGYSRTSGVNGQDGEFNTSLCNYGNSFGLLSDWQARFMTSGRSDWLRVNRVVAADFSGFYREGLVDPESGDVRANNGGWADGTVNTSRYSPLLASEWSTRDGDSNCQRTGTWPTGEEYDNQHRPAIHFIAAYATAGMWFVDAACQTALISVGREAAGGPDLGATGQSNWLTFHPGFRRFYIGTPGVDGTQYFVGTTQSAERRYWSHRDVSNAEFLHGDDEMPRRSMFEDMVRDPYIAHKKMLVDGLPRRAGQALVPQENFATLRPYGMFIVRRHEDLAGLTVQPWEVNYLSSVIIQDLMRERWRVKPWLEPFALYYLPGMTFAWAIPVNQGGIGCIYSAWLNDMNVNLGPADDNIVFYSRGWRDVFRFNMDPENRHLPISPSLPRTIAADGQSLQEWYTGSTAVCRTGTTRDSEGGYTASNRAVFSRALAVMGKRANIPGAAECLTQYKAALNYTDAASYYDASDYSGTRIYARWFFVE